MYASIEMPQGTGRPIVRRKDDWTLKEHEVVVCHWPDIAEIRRRLPHRSRSALLKFATKCNLRRPVHIWTQTEDALLRKRVREGVSRQALANELRMSLMQVGNRMGYANIRYPKKAPAPSGNRLMDAIFQRAFEMNLKRKDIDEICKSGSAFQRWSPARRLHIKHIKAAVNFLEGELIVEWSDL